MFKNILHYLNILHNLPASHNVKNGNLDAEIAPCAKECLINLQG